VTLRTTLAIPKFARHFGFKSSNEIGFRCHLLALQGMGAIKIVQNGFRGHSACHHKKIEVKDSAIVDAYFKGIRSIVVESESSPKEKPDFMRAQLMFWCHGQKQCEFKRYSGDPEVIVPVCFAPKKCRCQKVIKNEYVPNRFFVKRS
jgi:hypothetical protein